MENVPRLNNMPRINSVPRLNNMPRLNIMPKLNNVPKLNKYFGAVQKFFSTKVVNKSCLSFKVVRRSPLSIFTYFNSLTSQRTQSGYLPILKWVCCILLTICQLCILSSMLNIENTSFSYLIIFLKSYAKKAFSTSITGY